MHLEAYYSEFINSLGGSVEPAKGVRLTEAFRRLTEAPEAATAEEIWVQFSNILNQVEDEWTTIPYNPVNWAADGRLYPPQGDNARSVPGHPHVRRYRSLGHNTFVGSNGSIEIRQVDGTIEFQKAGSDGRYVWELGSA